MSDTYIRTSFLGHAQSENIFNFLEKLGAEYKLNTININKNEQLTPEFLKVSPNNGILAMIYHETGSHIVGSGAIMLYLTQKFGKLILKVDEYLDLLKWLVRQMGGRGPLRGRVHDFFESSHGKSPYGEERASSEAHKLDEVLAKKLIGKDFVAGEGSDEYSTSDIACWALVSRFKCQDLDLNHYPNVKEWYIRRANRPSDITGYQVSHIVNEV